MFFQFRLWSACLLCLSISLVYSLCLVHKSDACKQQICYQGGGLKTPHNWRRVNYDSQWPSMVLFVNTTIRQRNGIHIGNDWSIFFTANDVEDACRQEISSPFERVWNYNLWPNPQSSSTQESHRVLIQCNSRKGQGAS